MIRRPARIGIQGEGPDAERARASTTSTPPQAAPEKLPMNPDAQIIPIAYDARRYASLSLSQRQLPQ